MQIEGMSPLASTLGPGYGFLSSGSFLRMFRYLHCTLVGRMKWSGIGGVCRIPVWLGLSAREKREILLLGSLAKQLSVCARTFIWGVRVLIHFIWGEPGLYMDHGKWEGVFEVNVKSSARV